MAGIAGFFSGTVSESLKKVVQPAGLVPATIFKPRRRAIGAILIRGVRCQAEAGNECSKAKRTSSSTYAKARPVTVSAAP